MRPLSTAPAPLENPSSLTLSPILDSLHSILLKFLFFSIGGRIFVGLALVRGCLLPPSASPANGAHVGVTHYWRRPRARQISLTQPFSWACRCQTASLPPNAASRMWPSTVLGRLSVMPAGCAATARLGGDALPRGVSHVPGAPGRSTPILSSASPGKVWVFMAKPVKNYSPRSDRPSLYYSPRRPRHRPYSRPTVNPNAK